MIDTYIHRVVARVGVFLFDREKGYRSLDFLCTELLQKIHHNVLK
jgi:hypothetical protein